MSNQMYQKRELIEVIIKEKTYVFDKSVFSNSDLDILIAKGLRPMPRAFRNPLWEFPL